ncbi:SEC-C domain-containing protein, partial [bacterium]|nr:SEC-C domain-containing protein [bacterium]
FDYLRDNMAIHKENLVQRPHHYAIIDEVDSVLIDEARTPLIISGPVSVSTNKFAEMKPLVEKLIRSQTVLVNRLVGDGQRMMKEGNEYDAGYKFLQAHRGTPKNPRLVKVMREPGIQKLIRRVESDFMRDKKLHEVDEDLFYAVDEKSNTIDLTENGRQHIAPGNADMFVLPDLATQLSDIEGDESLETEERQKQKDALQLDYSEKSEKLHNISQLLRAYSLFEKDVEYVVSDDGKVMIVDEFTGRLMPGRRFSDGLHQALEAKENVRIERETQTLATITLQNLFRLYTKLAGMTGTAETEEGEFWEIYKLDVVVIPTNEPIRRDDEDDLIYKTKREKYNAICDEIEAFHKDGLPVLVGTVTVEVSETLSRMLRRRGVKHSVLNAKYHQKEAEIVASAGQPGMVTIATNMAGRGTDIKLGAGVVRLDTDLAPELAKLAVRSVGSNNTVLLHEVHSDNVQQLLRLLEEAGHQPGVVSSREGALELFHSTPLPGGIHIIPKPYGGLNDAKIERDNLIHIKARDYSFGGLHILGTERHESRRIDRQLRGRAGRQGDPGSSRFYLSLEDDLMRLFAPDRIIGVMDRLGVEEGEVISHPMVTKSIERAQKRVENRNFEIRKHLLEYDDVMNKQREVVYNRRRRALQGENLHDEMLELIAILVEEAVTMHTDGDHVEDWNMAGLADHLLKTMLLPLPFDPGKKDLPERNELIRQIQETAEKTYTGKRQMLGDDLMAQLERFATLKTIDERWKEHLYEMDQLKEGIGLRAYGQKDPLMEYKQEGFRTFTDMLGRIDEEIVEICFKAQFQSEAHETWTPRQRQHPMEMAAMHQDTAGMGFAGDRSAASGAAPKAAGKHQPVKVDAKVGRNNPCPCGSGKKFKHCHGRGN